MLYSSFVPRHSKNREGSALYTLFVHARDFLGICGIRFEVEDGGRSVVSVIGVYLPCIDQGMEE